MSIQLIKVFNGSPSAIPAETAFLYVTCKRNDADNRSIYVAPNTPNARLTLFADNYSEVAAVLPDWICGLDFSNKSMTLGIYSDSEQVSSLDVAVLAQIILPSSKIENDDGMPIVGFKLHTEAVIGTAKETVCA